MSRIKIAVIGGGLQGSSIALALASRGYHVSLIEQCAGPMMRASARNEGKIHLGFIYAHEKSAQTMRLMLEGALVFSPLLEQWCGAIPWQEWQSSRFIYALMPDSLCSENEIIGAYSRLSLLLADLSEQFGNSYLGAPLSWLWKPCSNQQLNDALKRLSPQCLFETEERSINPDLLARFISERVNQNGNIQSFYSSRVVAAERSLQGFQLHLIQNNQQETITADIVINCAWNDRERIDATLGIDLSNSTSSYRIKYQTLIKPRSPSALRALTMVQGPYGDLVPWNDGSVYISWYSIGKVYFSSNPPNEALLTEHDGLEIAEKTLNRFSEFFPELEGSEIISSLPGIIVAEGLDDVDNPRSQLHSRYNIGSRSNNGWWSVNTGKLTTAPMFAEQVAREVDDAIKS